MADLRTTLLGLDLRNPIMPAAGPPGRDGAALLACAAGGAGALVAKTISTRAAQPPTPNMAEIQHGMVNTELWSEMPPERWLEIGVRAGANERPAAHRQPGLHTCGDRAAGATDCAVRRRGRAIDALRGHGP